MIDKISATVLVVRDFDTCLKFYRDTLGLPLTFSDVNFAAFNFGNQQLALMHNSNASHLISEAVIQPNSTTEGAPRFFIAVFLDDVDKAYEAFKAKGVPFIKPPTTHPWGQRIAYFHDPEGNIWEISHFLEAQR